MCTIRCSVDTGVISGSNFSYRERVESSTRGLLIKCCGNCWELLPSTDLKTVLLCSFQNLVLILFSVTRKQTTFFPHHCWCVILQLFLMEDFSDPFFFLITPPWTHCSSFMILWKSFPVAEKHVMWTGLKRSETIILSF